MMIKALIVFIIVFGILWVANEIDEYYRENQIDLKEDKEIEAYKKRKEWENRH
jgi:hypothetical protein